MVDMAVDMGQLVREQARLSTRLRALAYRGSPHWPTEHTRVHDRFAELTAHGSAPDLAFVLLDVDRLKQVNDGHGHDEGNQALVCG